MNQDTNYRTEVSFKDFLIKNKRNRTILWISAVAIFIQFSMFKYFYPYPSFIHGDSFSYLDAAFHNLDINTYMVGYSRFLRLFSVFTTSDTALVGIQYLLLQTGSLFILFTVFYFYRPSIITQYILLLVMVFNPLFLHLSNLVSSDCLFASLSLIWFSLLLWIINKPSNKIYYWHALLLFILFTIRYNALIYPLISAIAFYLSTCLKWKKLLGISISIILCGSFIFYTSHKYKNLTGFWQYSPFSGWQLANNAMYAYRYVVKENRQPVPKKFNTLDRMIRDFFDTTKDIRRFPSEAVKAGTYYMWSPSMPLMKYRDSLFSLKDSTAGELKKWATMGPFYKKYGLYIIRQYPKEFLLHFIWPNAQKYYAPPLEFLQFYNSGKDYVTPLTKSWFEYKNQKVNTRFKDNIVRVLDFYPILSGILNVVMLFSFIFYWLLKGWKANPDAKKGITLGCIIWCFNACFTIGASSAALRFQSFPLLLTTIFVSLLVDWLYKAAMYSQSKSWQSQINEYRTQAV